MSEKEFESVRKLIAKKPRVAEKALEKWFKSIPKEELGKVAVGVFSQESEAVTYTVKDIYEALKKDIKAKKISDNNAGYLNEIVERYGEEK